MTACRQRGQQVALSAHRRYDDEVVGFPLLNGWFFLINSHPKSMHTANLDWIEGICHIKEEYPAGFNSEIHQTIQEDFLGGGRFV